MVTIVLPEWAFWVIFGMLTTNFILATFDLVIRQRLLKRKKVELRHNFRQGSSD